ISDTGIISETAPDDFMETNNVSESETENVTEPRETNNIVETENETEQRETTGISLPAFSAVLTKENKIYYYESTSKELIAAVTENDKVYNGVLSPDKTHIAYFHDKTFGEDGQFVYHIRVADIDGKPAGTFDFTDSGNCIYTSWWADSRRYVIDAHLNPSVCIFTVIDIETQEIIRYRGINLSMLENGDLLYVGEINHWVRGVQTGRLMINEKIVYDTGIYDAILSMPVKYGNKLGFIITNRDDDPLYTVLGDLSESHDAVTEEYRVDIPLEILGKHLEPYFDSNGGFYIIARFNNKATAYSYNPDTKKLEECMLPEEKPKDESEKQTEDSVMAEIKNAVITQLNDTFDGYSISIVY
ncbi:MAG: hypothetical protein VB118_07715, partial [Oscillospiraceae bacterium]|nr:hypothetical protein [Oscillospiraceae bacterium]